MTTTVFAPSIATARGGDVDNRAVYIAFGLAYILGHGAASLSKGDNPLVSLPGWLPMTLLGTGFAIGTVFATLAALRAQRDAGKPEVRTGQLLGLSWVVGFAALFLAITGISSTLSTPGLQTLLWPAGSGLVVGLIYLAEGAARRNILHYSVGSWLALVSTVALFFSPPVFFAILAIAGGGGYALATILEFRRHRR